MKPNLSGVKAERPFLIAILYPAYINTMVSQLHSTDDFSATEAQVHLKLAKQSKKTCGCLNSGESPNCQNALLFDFYLWFSHMEKHSKTSPFWVGKWWTQTVNGSDFGLKLANPMICTQTARPIWSSILLEERHPLLTASLTTDFRFDGKKLSWNCAYGGVSSEGRADYFVEQWLDMSW